MKLRQIFEAHHKADVAFCFGRFNPPHQGHAEVWNAVKHAGHQWFIGTNPSTIGPNDPLPFDLKTAWMTAIDPDIKGHILGEQSIVTLAAKIYQQVGDGATIAYVTDANDWAWSGKLLNDYNGKESNHGYFNFAKIIHVPSPRVSSATALRTAARAGDEQAFYHAAGTDPNLTIHGKTYFDTVAIACGQHPEKVKKAKKEKSVTEPLAQENLMSFMTKPTKKKVTASTEEMRKYFKKEKAKEPERVERGEGNKKVKQVYTKADENSVKYANKVIREMRAKDFLSEVNNGKGYTTELHTDHDAVAKGVSRSRDIGGYDRVYHMNRLMMAMAMADGQSTGPVKSAKDTWFEKYNTMHPMTQEEDNMIRAAMKTVPTDGQHITPFTKSEEPEGGNIQSVVAKPKKNKYGV
jgi:hypothetical protein